VSERGGGGNIPGATRRIPGIPSDAQFFDLSGFTTLNAQRPRAAIGDQEMAWSQNMMPIGPNYLRSLPDANPIATYTAGASPYAPPAVKYQQGITIIGATGVAGGDKMGPYDLPPFSITTDNTVLLLCISGYRTGNSPPFPPLYDTISSITDTAGLTFNLRGTVEIPISAGTQPAYASMWVYWASSPAPLAGEIVTVNFGEPTRIGVAALLALKGPSVVAPFDSNGSLPAFNFDTVANTTPAVPGISTDNPGDVLVSFIADYANYPNSMSLHISPGFTLQTEPSIGNIFTGDFTETGLFTIPLISPVSNIQAAPLDSAYLSPSWIAYTDAFTG
jgi:hypothetical protein